VCIFPYASIGLTSTEVKVEREESKGRENLGFWLWLSLTLIWSVHSTHITFHIHFPIMPFFPDSYQMRQGKM
jgi:hypothetical protein